MIIQKANLFKDLSKDAMNEIARIMVEESYEKGTQLYTTRDPAKYFYILVDGRVHLTMEAEIDYTLTREGEIFGWSSMVDRECYTANGECVIPTKAVKIDKDKLNQIFQKYPADGMTFFKGLAGAIAQRLIDNYNSFLSQGSRKDDTYGSRQVMTSAEE